MQMRGQDIWAMQFTAAICQCPFKAYQQGCSQNKKTRINAKLLLQYVVKNTSFVFVVTS